MIWVRTVLTTLVILAATWLGVALDVFQGSGGTLLIWLSAVLILVLPAILARAGVIALLGLFVAGLHVVMIFMTGFSGINGLILETRGVQVQARATGYTTSWTEEQFSAPSKYTERAGRRHAGRAAWHRGRERRQAGQDGRSGRRPGGGGEPASAR